MIKIILLGENVEQEKVLNQLKKRGHKLTPQRQSILKILMLSKVPLTALEVRRKVQKSHPRVSLNTVYLNLLLLTKLGLVIQTHLQNRSASRFEYQADGSHHHHAICLSCGKSLCLNHLPEPQSGKLEEDPGFQILGHTLEFYGYCSSCKKAT
jgi:Fur family transcriptional regulator, zinc uptake regulator